MSCFDDTPVEDLKACANRERSAGVSEVGIYYAIHEQIDLFPMPLNIGDADFTYEKAVTVSEDITFLEGKGFGKIVAQVDTGEVKPSIVGNKGNKKTKVSFDFMIPGTSKQALGFMRVHKNTPMVFLVTGRDGQKYLVGDKNNPAYISESEGTTGKSGEDDNGIPFTIESYCIPIVYEGAIQLPVVIP
ncbi:hypothetical protein [Flavobacterium beibuense]|uniref:hypothetical protein n=1 Tax=Flavobacterium beibuense TaxID=657326 RepID=UPI003A914CBD